MTIQEQEDKLYNIRSYLADKFHSLQLQAKSLNNVEDITKNKQTLAKISDCSDEIVKAYEIYNDVLCTEIEETNSDDDNDFFFDDFF